MGLLRQNAPQQTAPTQPMPQPAQVAQPDQAQTIARMKAVQKMALAGQKILYDSKLSERFKPILSGNDPAQIAGEVAFRVMLLVLMAAKLQADPNNVIPAGTILVGDVMDFLERARGIKHTDAQVESAIELFVTKMMQAVGGQQNG